MNEPGFSILLSYNDSTLPERAMLLTVRPALRALRSLKATLQPLRQSALCTHS